jgi:hypothetical protein
MVCESKAQALADAERDYGRGSQQYEDALGDLAECIRFYESIYEARAAHQSAWDERMYLHWKYLEDAWEALMKGFKPPRPWLKRTAEVRKQIFSKTNIAMVFSNKLEEAFKEAKIELKNDEAFECLICIREKPECISELVSPLNNKGPSSIDSIFAPNIMKDVMNARERDKIH